MKAGTSSIRFGAWLVVMLILQSAASARSEERLLPGPDDVLAPRSPEARPLIPDLPSGLVPSPPELEPPQPQLPGLPETPGLPNDPASKPAAAPDSRSRAADADLAEAPIWAGVRSGDRERRKLKNKAADDSGFTVLSEVIWQAPEPGRDAPFERGEWSTEDTLHIPVTGPMYVFTEAVLKGDYAADQQMKVVGRTGLLWKMPVGIGDAELRGGPSIKYLDALHLDRTRDQASVLLEVKAKLPLLPTLDLEYNGEALPAWTPMERPHLKQDLAFVYPVSGGKFKLGAKHKWDGLVEQQRPAAVNLDWYMAIEIGR